MKSSRVERHGCFIYGNGGGAEKDGDCKPVHYFAMTGTYILALMVEIRMSPATTRSSAAKPVSKLSEYRIWALCIIDKIGIVCYCYFSTLDITTH